MTPKDLIAELTSLKSSLQDKEILVVAPNGSLFEPVVKFNLKDRLEVLDHSDENVESLVLTYQEG